MCCLCSMSGYSPAMAYYLYHITSFFALHSILFRSAFFGLCSVDPVAIRGSIYIPRGRTLRQMQTQSSPAIICDLMLRRYHLHSCVSVYVCVCGLHFRLRFMWIYVCTTIYVMCLVALCVYTKRSNSLAFVYFFTWFSVSGFSFFFSPFCSRLVNVNWIYCTIKWNRKLFQFLFVLFLRHIE